MKKDYEIAKGAGRLVEVPASLIRTYMNLASAFQKEGKPVIKFSAGEPNFNTPSDIKEAAIRAITNNQTHYTSNKGYDPMRKAISAYMKEFFEVDYDYDKEILVTSSAAEALNNTMFAFVDDGDEVIIPTPSFVTYKALTSMCGAKIVNLPLKPEDSFQIDLAKLKASITDKTKMLILNNPCNPTGAVIPYETLKVICELAVEYNFLVLSDEIYGRLVYGNNKFYSVASFPGMKERTILVSGFSKTFAMTGWRIGYICADEPLFHKLLRCHQYSTTCSPTFIEIALAEAMNSTLTRKQVAEMITEFSARRDLIIKELDTIPELSYTTPQGAFYIMVNVNSLGLKGTEFSRKLLEEQYVATVPAIGLGEDTDTFVRFSYAASQEDIRQGFERIRKMVAGMRK